MIKGFNVWIHNINKRTMETFNVFEHGGFYKYCMKAYKEFDKDKINISPYEFIPYLLCFCKNVEECRERLSSINLINKPFMDDLLNPELHWIISDRNECITVEFVKEGMMIYDNKVGVLTNNPIFPYHIWNLSNYYIHLSFF